MSKRTRILQVAYVESLRKTRTLMLQREGYTVVSALGNAAAIALAETTKYDIVVVGHSADSHIRAQIIHWFKQHRPTMPVIALCARIGEWFPDADDQSMTDDPHDWLAVLAKRAA